MSVRFSAAVSTVPWYVVVNDLVGGWAVSHVDKPLSQQDARAGEGELFDCITKELAEYIVALHQAQLDRIADQLLANLREDNVRESKDEA